MFNLGRYEGPGPLGWELEAALVLQQELVKIYCCFSVVSSGFSALYPDDWALVLLKVLALSGRLIREVAAPSSFPLLLQGDPTARRGTFLISLSLSPDTGGSDLW